MPIEPPATVVVTGANGFIGSHIVQQLLEAGFAVRATVRDPDNADKTAHLSAMTEGRPGSLTFARGDLLEAGSFDAACAGADAVIHCAAAVFFSAEDPQRDLVDPSVKGTLNVLDSVRRSGTVKRVVHTSSVAAVMHWDTPAEHVFSEADWNTTSGLNTDPYGLAKVSAERAADEYVAGLPEDERFELVHLNPGMVWGPPLIKAHAKASPSLLRDVISHAQPGVPKLWMSVVDVREVAEAHVRAVSHPDPPKRCLLIAEDAWMNDLARMLQDQFPDVKMATRAFPKPLVLLASLFDKTLNTQQLRHLVGRPFKMDATLSRRAYALDYRSLSDTLRDTAAPMIDNGWARVTRR